MAELLRLERSPGAAVGADLTDAWNGGEGCRRGRFLGVAVLTGAGLLVGAEAAGAASPAQDRPIVRFLLQLEYLQAAFYSAAESRGQLRGETREYAEVVGAHERKHVALLKQLLGGKAPPEPTFDFGDATADARRFARAAHRLEETAVGAYVGQGANLTARTVTAVSRITAVEGRHAAWIADFLGRTPAPLAADRALSAKQVLAAVRRTGFVRSR